MDSHLNVAYLPADSSDPLHSFDFFVPHATSNVSETAPPLICFVHGGAWRSEDKGEYSTLARRLAARTGYPVAVPNYRLTGPDTPIQHPEHALDILRFLTFIRTWRPPAADRPPYDPNRIFLIGHSCSAHMLASLVLASPPALLAPPDAVLRAVRGVVCSEGIYDVDLLLASFPGYRAWFIADAFGDRASYAEFAVSTLPCRPNGAHVRWMIVHSSGDTLVDVRQSETMYAHLLSLEDSKSINSETSVKVQKDFDTLDAEHNDILKTDQYVEMVAKFILD